MSTLWETITNNSTLPVAPGTTLWEHLHNQAGGTTIGGVLAAAIYGVIQQPDVAGELQQTELAGDISAVKVTGTLQLPSEISATLEVQDIGGTLGN